MSGHVQKTIDDLKLHIHTLEDEIADTKKTINSLCKTIGQSLLYANVDAKPVLAVGAMRPDLFYGKPLATVVRSILEMRQAMDLGPAPVTEIYDQMIEGGFVFDGANVDNRKRVLRISLAKNSSVFHKLPNGSYGLLEWYPAVKTSRKNGSAKPDQDDSLGEEAQAEKLDDSDEPELVATEADSATLRNKPK